MPLALPEMAVFIASTISETTDCSEPVHWDVVPSRACASSMPYWVGMKNGFVVTWLTKTKFHSGVFGKLPPDPPEPHPGSPAAPPHACTLRATVPRTPARSPRETACGLACSPRSPLRRIHAHSSITPVCSFPTTLPLPTLLYQYVSVST